MRIRIERNIFAKYPSTTIGYVVVSLKVGKADAHIKSLKKSLIESVKSMGITEENFAKDPNIAGWRKIFKDFDVPENYVSSVESLIKRVLDGGNLWSISNIVDLYNCCSVLNLMPMGGYDLEKIKGDIVLRFGKTGETIQPLGKSDPEQVAENHVVYSDDDKVICWLWNYRDSKFSCIDFDTRRAIFFIDAGFLLSGTAMNDALKSFEAQLTQIGAQVLADGIVDAKHPEISIDEEALFKDLPKSARKIEVSNPAKVVADKQGEHGHTSLEHDVRVGKVKDMRAAGIEPWPQFKPVNATTQEVLAQFAEPVEGQPASSPDYQIAGRIITLREHGKTIFATIQDRTGRLQIYLRSDEVGQDKFEFFKKYVDLGDIIWCQGTSFRTKMGEITLKVATFELLSKCLHPLPEKFHGIHDVEIKHRQRYLDLISSPESRERFKKRSKIIRLMREFFDTHDFIEVETPMLHPIPGGAAAKPFETHHNALDMQLFLRIAPELFLKRLTIGGLERVYEINRNFRNEGVSPRHNPEFTSVEWYITNQDYHWMMDFVEEMLKHVVKNTNDSMIAQYGDLAIDFGKPFARLPMKKAVMQYVGCTEQELEGDNIDAVLKKHKIKPADKNASWGQKLYALFEELVESQLIQPTFVTEFPVEVSPLAKRNPENPAFCDRFEMFIAGMEICNAFNELNDPFDQAERFHEQARARKGGDDEAHYYDADFITAVEYGLPPTVGAGIGIDRLVMLITGTTSIRDVILFPTMRKTA